MRILKFGGSSLGTPARIESVVRLIADAAGRGRVAVVVSAFGGMTDELLAAAGRAGRREDEWQLSWQQLLGRHCEAAQALAGASERVPILAEVKRLCEELRDLLHGVFLLLELPPRSRDAILSYGERLSAVIVAAALRARGMPARSLDARDIIVTDGTFGEAQVDFAATAPRVVAVIQSVAELPVVTGFIGATASGETTTLGRGGSDYTASILGAALSAEMVELWTDVDGVLTADPRLVPAARVLPALSYAELMELSHFGAKVVHPPSVHPVRAAAIPLSIKNTLRPDAPGTLVTAQPPPAEGGAVLRGLSSIHEVALMRLEGDGMVGVPGIAMRLFGALARERISVILISQASSEHSICFAVTPEGAEQARRAVNAEFALERKLGLLDDLVAEHGLSIVAAVGERMRERAGIAGQLFGILGRHAINVRAIAQGSSERNVSFVVDRADEARALQALHAGFFEPRRTRIDLAVVGVGRVGGALLDQIAAARPRLSARGVELRVVVAASSQNALIDAQGLDLACWREQLGRAPAIDTAALAKALGALNGAHQVFADLTASDDVPAWYAGLMERGVSVVAANKRLFAGPLARWRDVEAARRASGSCLEFETTVGAGLPVLRTLRDLIATGDSVSRIDGVLSGTIGAVLEAVMAGQTLSAAVFAAHAGHLTEPHPWDDLSGQDVARKLVILARCAGLSIELEDVAVEALLPGQGWAELAVEDFWARLPDADAEIARRRADAVANGRRLRYVGRIEDGRARAGLEAVGPEHYAWGLARCENLVAFRTARYSEQALVVRGPGAGPEVTAAGVFAGILEAGGATGSLDIGA